MDLADPKLWGVAFDVLQCGVIAALWLRKPGEDATQQVTAVKGELAVLQERMKHMPTSEELSDLAGNVKAIETQIEAQTESLATLRGQLNRIENYLLQQKS